MSGKGQGVVADIVVGLIGALAGGFLARSLGVTTALTSHSIIVEIVIAFAGAVILLALLRIVGVGKRRTIFR
ncbi:MAG: GlsB/YeaQ/YmgE family stress response membrane protein [Candidatus Dormiibacterota bacterium]